MSFPKLILIAMFLVIPAQSYAQTTNQTNEEATVNTPEVDQPKITTLPPAYETQMLRLSEILGSLHYLRELCGAKEDQKWRQAMQDMIKDEEPSDERKAQMIANFNHGFRGFQETYRECTNAAIEANNRYIAEGVKLSGEIPSRYGR